jgi:hypothetical protein
LVEFEETGFIVLVTTGIGEVETTGILLPLFSPMALEFKAVEFSREEFETNGVVLFSVRLLLPLRS